MAARTSSRIAQSARIHRPITWALRAGRRQVLELPHRERHAACSLERRGVVALSWLMIAAFALFAFEAAGCPRCPVGVGRRQPVHSHEG